MVLRLEKNRFKVPKFDLCCHRVSTAVQLTRLNYTKVKVFFWIANFLITIWWSSQSKFTCEAESTVPEVVFSKNFYCQKMRHERFSWTGIINHKSILTIGGARAESYTSSTIDLTLLVDFEWLVHQKLTKNYYFGRRTVLDNFSCVCFFYFHSVAEKVQFRKGPIFSNNI